MQRLEEARENVAQLRAWLAAAAPAPGRPDHAGGPGEPDIGLAAARRAVRISGAARPLTDPVAVELTAQANIAVGSVPWGLGPWLPAGHVLRLPASDGSPAAGAQPVITAALGHAAGRSLIVVVRDAHRHPAMQDAVTGLLAARPDTVVVEMGLPLWRPPAGRYLATYGAAQCNAQAAAEILGLARPPLC